MNDDAGARVRLEGDAELLEATVPRYRLLVRQLKSVWWQQRVRRTAAVLREVTHAQARVELAIAKAKRHADAERWGPSSALRATLEEVIALRGELERLTSRRLGDSAKGHELPGRLQALEHQVLVAPRFVLPGRRWATAVELLPWPSSELTPLAGFATRLEAVFGRPHFETGGLAFSLEELDAVAGAWHSGTAALDAVWSRIASVDRSGVLTAYLRARARRTPTRQPNTGPEVLLHAEFWRSLSSARIDAALAMRISPVVANERERFAVLRWVWLLERAPTAALVLDSDERSALIELASLFNRLPSHRQWQSQQARALELAARADHAKSDPDWQRVHDSLAVLWRVLASSAAKGLTASVGLPPDSLRALIQHMAPFTEPA